MGARAAGRVRTQPADPLVEAARRHAAGGLAAAGYAVEEVELPRAAEAAALWPLLVMNDDLRSPWVAGQRDGDAAFKGTFRDVLAHTRETDFERMSRGYEARLGILRC